MTDSGRWMGECTHGNIKHRCVICERDKLQVRLLACVNALKSVLIWRDGPEGPEVMFSQGCTMLRLVRDAIEQAEQP